MAASVGTMVGFLDEIGYMSPVPGGGGALGCEIRFCACEIAIEISVERSRFQWIAGLSVRRTAFFWRDCDAEVSRDLFYRLLVVTLYLASAAGPQGGYCVCCGYFSANARGAAGTELGGCWGGI